MYFVPASNIEDFNNALANPELKVQFSLPDAWIPRIQPQISAELAEIYDAFGIKTENIIYYGNVCTVLVASINDLVGDGVISAESADTTDLSRAIPTDRVHRSLNKITLKRIYRGGGLTQFARTVAPMLGINYLHIVSPRGDVFVHPGDGDDAAELMKVLNI